MTIQKCVTNEYVGHLSRKVSMVIGSRLILPLPSTVCMAKRSFIKYWLYLFVHLFMDSFVLQIWKQFETWWNLIYPFDWSSTPWGQSSTLDFCSVIIILTTSFAPGETWKCRRNSLESVHFPVIEDGYVKTSWSMTFQLAWMLIKKTAGPHMVIFVIPLPVGIKSSVTETN